MNKNYQERLDEIFGKGSLWKHRTLRTLFDPLSNEYNQTTMEKKLEIMRVMRENEMDLNEVLSGYKEFYTEENKRHVVEIADEGYEILIRLEKEN